MPLFMVSAHAQIKAYTLVRADDAEKALAIAAGRKVDPETTDRGYGGKPASSLESWLLVPGEVVTEKLDGIAAELMG